MTEINNLSEAVLETTHSEMFIYEVNENFIKPGSMHEYGVPRYERDPLTGDQVCVDIQWGPIWIESVEIIGSQVYLGVKDVVVKDIRNYDPANPASYDVGGVVFYESLSMYPRLQIAGTVQKRKAEIKALNDKNIADQIISGEIVNIPKEYLNDVIEALRTHYPDFNYTKDTETSEQEQDGQKCLVIRRIPDEQR